MNSKDYTYIVEIARQGSISKAAGRLYITQPALSRFLQRTEEELGTPLFYKAGKQLVPTAAGECYLKHAEVILQQNLKMQEELDQIIHNNTNVIKIGASGSRGEFLVSWLLPLFYRKYPEYRTKLTLNRKDTLLQMLDKHELDVVFVNTAAEPLEYICCHIAREDMVLLVNDGHFLLDEAVVKEGCRYPFVRAESWKDCPFIIPAASMNTGQFMRSYLKHLNFNPPVVSEIEHLGLIFSAVENKMGISIVPSMPHMSVFCKRLHYLSLEGEENGIWNFSAVIRPDTDVSKGIQKLINTAKEVYAAVVQEKP